MARVLRVVAVEEAMRPTEAVVEGEGPQGESHFVTETPVTVEPGHSTMVTLFDEKTEAERVYLFDPVSARGSDRYAFNAVRVVNPSDETLESGPVTVYAGSKFLGEGLTEVVPPRSAALVPYALDRAVVVETAATSDERIASIETISGGVAETAAERVQKVTHSIVNRGREAATVYVRHRVPEGWELDGAPDDLERIGEDVLFPVTVEPGAERTLTIAQARPATDYADLRTGLGIEAIEAFLSKHSIDEPLQSKLEAIVEGWDELRVIDRELASAADEARVLEERLADLRFQLSSLGKVSGAEKLRRDLAKRIEKHSDRLDDVTVRRADLEGERLQAQIELDASTADLRYPRTRLADAD